MTKPIPTQEEAQNYIQENLLNPVLKKALSELCKEKPAEPVRWLANYLLNNNPNKPNLQAPDSVTFPDGAKMGNAPKMAVASKATAGSGRTKASEEAGRANAEARTGDILAAKHVLVYVSVAQKVVQTDGMPVIGVSQPALDDVQEILNAMRMDCRPDRKILWVDLRSRPLVFINRRPYSLHALDGSALTVPLDPNDAASLVHLSKQLKDDIIHEASRNGSKILLHERVQTSDVMTTGSLACFWEEIFPESVLTVEEVMAAAVAHGSAVAYSWLPMPDDGQLSDAHISALTVLNKALSFEDARILQNATGDGLVTAAMAVTALQWRAQCGYESPVPVPPRREGEDASAGYLLGEYRAAMQIADGLESGLFCKLLLDDALDRCSVTGQNLREIILERKNGSENTQYREERRAQEKEAGVTALRQYCWLILAAAYVREAAKKDYSESFGTFLSSRKELQQIASGAAELE